MHFFESVEIEVWTRSGISYQEAVFRLKLTLHSYVFNSWNWKYIPELLSFDRYKVCVRISVCSHDPRWSPVFYWMQSVAFDVLQSECVIARMPIVHLSVYMHMNECVCSSVCSDLSCRNSCSGVALITGWVFWGELPTAPSLAPTPPLLSAVLQGSLQMTECFCPALWNPCHIPFQRTAQQQRSLHVAEQIGKKHRQNFGGKRPQFVPSGSCCRLSKESYFCFMLPDLVCLCMLVWGRFLPPFSCFERKKIQFVSTHSPSGCYFWTDSDAGPCWD